MSRNILPKTRYAEFGANPANVTNVNLRAEIVYKGYILETVVRVHSAATGLY